MMNELKVKKDFTDIYTQDSPCSYLKEMEKLEYDISDSTKPLYNSIIEQLEETLSRPINILDLGSSYGINSALIKYDLTMSELNDFFLPLIEATPPPTGSRGRYVRFKYVTQLPTKFPSFAFFCNFPDEVKDAYSRFLENKLRDRYNFNGVPVQIYFRQK